MDQFRTPSTSLGNSRPGVTSLQGWKVNPKLFQTKSVAPVLITEPSVVSGQQILQSSSKGGCGCGKK